MKNLKEKILLLRCSHFSTWRDRENGWEFQLQFPTLLPQNPETVWAPRKENCKTSERLNIQSVIAGIWASWQMGTISWMTLIITNDLVFEKNGMRRRSLINGMIITRLWNFFRKNYRLWIKGDARNFACLAIVTTLSINIKFRKYAIKVIKNESSDGSHKSAYITHVWWHGLIMSIYLEEVRTWHVRIEMRLTVPWIVTMTPINENPRHSSPLPVPTR